MLNASSDFNNYIMAKIESYGYGLQYVKNQTILSTGTKSESDLTPSEKITASLKLQEADLSSRKYYDAQVFLKVADKKIEVFTKIAEAARNLIIQLSTELAKTHPGNLHEFTDAIIVSSGINEYLTANTTIYGINVYALAVDSNIELCGINYSSGLRDPFSYNNNGFVEASKNFGPCADAPLGAREYVERMLDLSKKAEKAIVDIKAGVIENKVFVAAMNLERENAENAANNVDAVYKDINGDKLAYEMQRAEHLSAILHELRMAASERLTDVAARVFAQEN